MPEILQTLGLRSYSIIRRSGLLSLPLAEQCYARAYFFYKRRQEAPQTALIARLVPPGTLAIDVGANIGYFTTILAGAVGPAGTVVAFEPDARNLRGLRRTVERYGLANTLVVPSAVGDYSGRAQLWVNPDHPADHRMYAFKGHAGGSEVDIVTLDDFLSTHEDPRTVSVVKVDVQGAELHVLRGMRGTLERHTSAHLLLEVAPDHLAEGGTRLSAVRDFLAGLGFAPYFVAARGTVRSESWETVESVARRKGYVDVLFSRSIPADLLAD